MKLKLFSTVSFSIAMLAASAQMGIPSSINPANPETQKVVTQTQASATQTVNKAEADAKGTVGTLLAQFAGQIQPSALTDEFNKVKPTFQTEASNSTDVKSTSGLLQKLAGGLKAGSFSPNWAKMKDAWVAKLKSATTQQQLAASLKTLSQNIDPKSFSNTWANVKPTFVATLEKLIK
jgi:hypothetical protein